MADTRYDAFISYRREVPLMRRYYNDNGVENGLMKVSYYTYGNLYPDKDCQNIIESSKKSISYISTNSSICEIKAVIRWNNAGQ